MEYDHTQKAPLHWILVVPGTAMLVSAWYASPDAQWVGWVLGIVGAIMVGISLCFRTLRLQSDEGDLTATFGPVQVFHKRVAYARIAGFRADRSNLIDGWGIHFRPGAGWIWNLWGFDCVRLELDDGTPLRFGTDDVAGLLAHLEARTAHAGSDASTKESA